MNSTSQYKTGIVDIIIFYAPYGVELLDFRINLLKDYVDWFIITESNRTQTGEYIDYQFEEVASKLDLPMDKIIYVKGDIPEMHLIEPTQHDINSAITCNKYGVQITNTQIASKSIEGMQKDVFTQVLNQFDYDTFFLFGDSDEILNPHAINWLCDMCKKYPNNIILIPLKYMVGRADLQAYYVDDIDKPVVWSQMFIAQRHHFDVTAPHVYRRKDSNSVNYEYCYPTQDGVVADNLGWHFSWMGSIEQKKIKFGTYTHKLDVKYGYINFNDEQYSEYIESTCLRDGSSMPDGDNRYFLRKVDLSELPDLIFSKREYIDFFFALK